MIQFFINRTGKSLPAARRAELEEAKRLLQNAPASGGDPHPGPQPDCSGRPTDTNDVRDFPLSRTGATGAPFAPSP